jgi:glycosyltransferase involved in cell wall biosynthesis
VKILYLTNHLNIGGITSYVLTLASGMKKRGHDIHVASSGGELLGSLMEKDIAYLPIPIKTKSEISYKVLLSRLRLSAYLKEKEIDIVHANTRVTQVLGCITGKPYISTCHGFFQNRLSRRLFPCWGRRVIAISEPVKEHLVRDLGARQEDITVIHNGIDVDRFGKCGQGAGPELKKKMGLKDGPVVGIIARLSEEKGHIYLIEAMRDVIARIPAAQLLIVGEGKKKEKLTELVKEKGLDKSVLFIPAVMDTREALSVMDIFVLPSLKEGLGLALMEAMASGVAVIGSDVGGIRSLIKDQDTGLLFAAGDSGGLAEAISELLWNPDKAKILGTNARSFIDRDFSQEKMVIETERVYLQCLKNVNS